MIDESDANSEFREALILYRKHFGLTQQIVADIANMKQSEYSDFESGKRPLHLNDADDISKRVYGMGYKTFAKNNEKYPAMAELPQATQEAIQMIKEKGTKLRTSEGKLANALDNLISTGKLDHPITAKEVFELMPPEIQEHSKENEITNLLGKSPRNKIIEQVGKKGRSNLYKLRKMT